MMSSDEDFSLLPETQPSEDTSEGIGALIANYKKKHEQLVQEQRELAACRDNMQGMCEKFKQRSDKLTQDLKNDQRSYRELIENEKVKLHLMQQEENDLMKAIQRVEEALREEEVQHRHLKQQTSVFTAVPEKQVVFTGLTGSEESSFEMEPHIVYPVEGGTALITFEDQEVARKILDMKKHQVDLGAECSITVEAQPVRLMLPKLVEIDTEVSTRHILISNLPKIENETLLNLEIHFSKRKHGGGEVEQCELLPDSGTVVITFVEDDIARGLTDKEYHDVKLQQKMHRVRVTPFLHGKITDLKTEMTVCPRTLLLTGIPAVTEPETLQDLLEIHFQKSSNGGGEIEAFLYNPVGQHTSALFEGVSTSRHE